MRSNFQYPIRVRPTHLPSGFDIESGFLTFDGNEVANWPVSAYGKSQTASFSGSQALQRAAILAMRDAAALMIIKLDEMTGISKLAESRAATAVPTATETVGGAEPSALEESSDDD